MRISTIGILAIHTAFVIGVTAPSGFGQYKQQGGKLVGSDGSGSSNQGHSVAISADGQTAIVGGYGDGYGAGAAWIYTQIGGVWIQQGGKLVGSNADDPARQGVGVALSSDGNRAIVGGFTDNNGVGAAWVFNRNGSTWTQDGNKLIGQDATGNAWQGTSVAISADGNTALVGGYYDNSNKGAAWVFTKSGSLWLQQGPKLVGSGASGTGWQGGSVALSADGNTAIVGSTYDSNHVGAAWVYTRTAGVWTQQGSKLVANDVVGGGQFGVCVALSADGNTAAIGGYLDNGGHGAMWIYTRTDTVWSQQGNKLIGTGAIGASAQGRSVAISGDGNTAFSGGQGDNGGIGAVWVFKRSGGIWSQDGPKLVGLGGTGDGGQGLSLSASADASTFIEGAEYDNSSTGAAWVFSLNQTTFKILSVSDIPVDQGGKVRLKWNAAALDTPYVTPQITSYSIWRKSPAGQNKTLPKMLPPASLAGDTSLLDYDYVTVVPAVQIPRYQTVVPTLADSTSDGINRFTFLVVAHTSDVNQYFVSAPDSGYSVDNLAPSPPGNLTGVALSPGVSLHWSQDFESDLKEYVLFRSDTPGINPLSSTPFASIPDTAYYDGAPLPAGGRYYVVCARDIHGNLSKGSNEVNVKVSGVEDRESGVPTTYALYQNYPNPFNPSTTIRFDIPRDGFVSIRVFNTLGQEAGRLVNQDLAAGRYQVPFDGTTMLSGVYFCRLSAVDMVSGQTVAGETIKLLLLR